VAAVQQLAHGRQPLQGREHRQQVIPLGVGGVLVEIDRGPVLGVLQTGPRPRQPRLRQQPVVFQKAHEHAGQHPSRRRLGDQVGAPLDEVQGGAARRLGGLVFRLELGLQTGLASAIIQDVPLQEGQQALQVGEQLGAVDHGGTGLWLPLSSTEMGIRRSRAERGCDAGASPR
jgi:hypothetical protein